jgi:dynein heavy chain
VTLGHHRFFFLSNDELLEILAETKDPLRVQPFCKKIFEGINRLNFEPNMDITAMISEEGERVDFVFHFNPQTAMGAVEKWLLEVRRLRHNN